MRTYDYYIFIDYSENLIGYNIIKREHINLVSPLLSRLKHYKKVKHKKEYLTSIKKLFLKEHILELFLKAKILPLRKNLEIYAEIFEFIKKIQIQ